MQDFIYTLDKTGDELLGLPEIGISPETWEKANNFEAERASGILEKGKRGVQFQPLSDASYPRSLNEFPPASNSLAPFIGMSMIGLSYRGQIKVRDFQIMERIVRLYEAGTFMIWMWREAVAIVRNPKIGIEKFGTDNRYRFHCENGPSVLFADGEAQYHWHGTQVYPIVILKPDTVPVGEIMAESNMERRRAILDRIGWDRVLRDLKATVIMTDDTGELLELQLHDDNGRAARFLRVKDSSTDRAYVIRTHPTVKSCREGLARSFQVKPSDYHMAKET
jgi:hypothetical protein